MTLNCAPELRPYSTLYGLVWTAISCTASGTTGVVEIVTLTSLLSDPSIMKLLLRVRWPLAEMPSAPGPDTTLGESSATRVTSRVGEIGSSTTCRAFMTIPTVALVRLIATPVASATTCTVSSRPPTVSAGFSVASWPEATRMSFVSKVLNPWSSTRTV